MSLVPAIGRGPSAALRFPAVAVLLLLPGCMSPVTDFLLPPESGHAAPHPIDYAGPSGSVLVADGIVTFQPADGSTTAGDWRIEGDLVWTRPDGTSGNATEAVLEGGGTIAADTVRLPWGATVADGDVLWGSGSDRPVMLPHTFDLAGDVRLEGTVAVTGQRGPGTLQAAVVTVEARAQQQVRADGAVHVAVQPLADAMLGAATARVTLPVEDLRVRGHAVDGDVTLHLATIDTLTITETIVQVDGGLVQLDLEGRPRLGCRFTPVMGPDAASFGPDGRARTELRFRVDGPGAAVRADIILPDDDLEVDTGIITPVGAAPDPSPRFLGVDMAPGVTYTTQMEAWAGDGGTVTLEGRVKARNCPDMPFSWTITP